MLPLPAGRDASSGVGPPLYARHRPERTPLYLLVREYYPASKAHLVAQGAELPRYVEREFEEYLACGRLEHGFLRVRCDSCHAEHLVAFGCRRRGFCPSCGARRMAESAALLVDEVFPEGGFLAQRADSKRVSPPSRAAISVNCCCRWPSKALQRKPGERMMGTTGAISLDT